MGSAPTKRSVLSPRWVSVTGPAGRERLEMRWSVTEPAEAPAPTTALPVDPTQVSATAPSVTSAA